MRNMTLAHVAQVVDGQLVTPAGTEALKNTEIQGAVNDNRKVEKDFLFIPMVGARVDGHDFIEDAFSKGALASLSERELDNPTGPYIIVKDTKLALKQIATDYRMQLSIPVIGIIGSVGKTSTKEMLASVLGTKYEVLKTEGNFNNEIGLPLTICRIKDEHQVAVVEMGISDFGEMHRLGDIAKPDYVVMTNIGQCHLEFLKTRDGILQAKTEVFEHMNKNGAVILNGDDDKLINADTLGIRRIFYGLNGQEVSASDVTAEGMTGTRAVINAFGDTFEANIPLPGTHNVMNALAATAMGKELGLTDDEIKRGLEKASTIAGRNNVIEVRDITIIDDCYNANPVSMKASIEVLGKAPGRSIAVLGDMGELGEDERQLHYEIGQALEDNHIGYVFTVGELSEEINKSLSQKNSSCMAHHYADVEAMLEDLLPIIRGGDTILVKASHFMNFSTVVEAIKTRFE
ncbi:UDP-N-acetylmuramoyl-tripeptide--D-alanyl-D-alanine ligase [Pseudobutyrivibrio xylanivorans]|uniref:UDP-N-acetylmuramoyl-tripeptide--D-alanyl-D-alanine ligase n=1 Tax=Pseudobutyrivibrio xylanivorans DSM 14809 TaxID=1123012 RepID=A0A1M6FDZ4_PSEXY|nr:UDP-N-acetylmuramoyl-tripeptide--D-alanyl-D-alanine ligase [Pseudobutyrivibrio xylanivorans]SHI95892.1 UDP-N-acetylmuramoyl-tripeptide--D-alanyl-D-alanine ligase [Pseudobutyrivibrio xylanivorans DSM 14809]